MRAKEVFENYCDGLQQVRLILFSLLSYSYFKLIVVDEASLDDRDGLSFK